MMNFAPTLQGLSRSIFQKNSGSGNHQYSLTRGFAKLHKKKQAIDSYVKSAKSRCTTDQKREENCTNDQVAKCTSDQVAKCTNVQVEEFREEDFCGEVFSGGEDFCGDEFHGEDFNKEEFEGDKIFRSNEFTFRIPISSKKATQSVDNFIASIYNTHQHDEK